MDIHSNARTCPNSRATIVDHIKAKAWTSDQAFALGVSIRTGFKWWRRFRTEGPTGLQDRSSRPKQVANRTGPQREQLILRLRECGQTAREIAVKLRMPRSTVSAILQRHGVGRLSDLQPSEPVRRYEHKAPGEMLHLDVKKLGRIRGVGHRITGDRRTRARGVGWEFVHVAIDDASRILHAEVLPDERGATCAAFLRRAVLHYRRLGIVAEQILTDNGSGYTSHVFRRTVALERLQHLRTRPYRPCTNGKAERVIQTMLREWAYARPYRRSRDRTRTLRTWIGYYNRWRPHGSLAGNPPLSRLDTPVNNVSGNYS